MKIFKKHYHETKIVGTRGSDRLCQQDRSNNNTTTVIADVNCRKCLRILYRRNGASTYMRATS